MAKENETKQVKDWAVEKNAIKARIQKLKGRYYLLRVNQLQQDSGDAKFRKDSFLHQHGGDEGKLSERDRRTLEILADDYGKKFTAWQAALKAQRKDHKELEQLGRQLAENKFPLSLEAFSVKGVGPFLRRAVSPWTSEIKAAQELLTQLRQKQKALVSELVESRYIKPDLSEAQLLETDADGNISTINERREVEKKVESLEDLIERTTTAIKAKVQEVDELKKKFADALTSAVEAYTNEGRRKTAAAVKVLMEEDETYHQQVTSICNQLIARVGAKPVDVYGFTGSSSPAATRIFPGGHMDKTHISTQIEAALNPQEQPLI